MKHHGPFPVTIMPNNITTLKEANNNKALKALSNKIKFIQHDTHKIIKQEFP
jgi:hypothetical protein